MFTQFLGAAATVYGVLAALKSLLQTRQMLARRSAREVSAGFLASYAGGYAIWLAYGLSTRSLPLILVDTVGLLCAGLTLAVALFLRPLVRPATWNRRSTTSISPRPAAPDLQPGEGDPVVLKLAPRGSGPGRLRELGYEVSTSAGSPRSHARRQDGHNHENHQSDRSG